MTTFASRLKTLSSMSGATVAAMLLAIGSSGNTLASCVIDYSGLPSGTVVDHILVDHSGSGEVRSGTLTAAGTGAAVYVGSGFGAATAYAMGRGWMWPRTDQETWTITRVLDFHNGIVVQAQRDSVVL